MDEAHALQCTNTGPYNAIPTSLFCVGSICGLGPDLLGIRSIRLSLNGGLKKIQAARGNGLAPVFALSSDWELKFLISSMAACTSEAFNTARCLDHSG